MKKFFSIFVIKLALIFSSIILPLGGISAAPLSYQLKPELIAENTYLLKGKLEDFSNANGGNIVNTAFVITEEGVVVIDTGPSLRYGKEMRAVISSMTDQPIKYVFNTHHHPDHFLGNQAFADIGVMSLAYSQEQIKLHGDAFAENMYRLVGDWMRSTEVSVPSIVIESDRMQLGGHRFQLLSYTGHSGADLVIFDQTTGVVFASDMVFYQRALTTPHTPGLLQWKAELEDIQGLPFKVMVPGHGPVVHDDKALKQMIAYLGWLDQTLTAAAEEGLSMTELISLPIREDFAGIALTRREFARTVAHLYPKYEEQAF